MASAEYSENGYNGYVENTFSVSELVHNFFAGEYDVILDTSMIYTIKKHMLENDSDIGKLNRELIKKTIGFTQTLINELVQNKERVLIFPELRGEYTGLISGVTSMIEQMKRKRPSTNSNSISELADISNGIEIYLEAVNKLDSVAREQEKKSSFDHFSESMVALFSYLKNAFPEWKDNETSKTVDEKIIAYTFANSMLNNKPTKTYSRDNKLISFAEKIIYFLTSKQLTEAAKTKSNAGYFVNCLKRADIKFLRYNRQFEDFEAIVHNTQIQQKNPEFAFPGTIPPQKQAQILRIVLEYMEDTGKNIRQIISDRNKRTGNPVTEAPASVSLDKNALAKLAANLETILAGFDSIDYSAVSGKKIREEFDKYFSLTSSMNLLIEKLEQGKKRLEFRVIIDAKERRAKITKQMNELTKTPEVNIKKLDEVYSDFKQISAEIDNYETLANEGKSIFPEITQKKPEEANRQDITNTAIDSIEPSKKTARAEPAALKEIRKRNAGLLAERGIILTEEPQLVLYKDIVPLLNSGGVKENTFQTAMYTRRKQAEKKGRPIEMKKNVGLFLSLNNIDFLKPRQNNSTNQETMPDGEN